MDNKKVYIIAEAGVNHNGSIDMAKQLIDIAAKVGADAIKFQTFKTEKFVSFIAPKADYQKITTDSTESQFEMIKKLELNEKMHQILIEYCEMKGIKFLSTAFDLDSLSLLTNTFNISALKLSSGEITNIPFLVAAARSKKPIILSTGMSTLGEIEIALGALAFGYVSDKEKPSILDFQQSFTSKEGQKVLFNNVTLLHCTTEYPTPFIEVNLRVMDTLKTAFGLPVGLSDHTPEITVPIAAAARGAVIIEKHFTLDKNLPGPDHKASLTPDELKEMIESIRRVEIALGSSLKIPTSSELKNISIARKSLVASRGIRKDEIFTVENLTVKRPGNGISPLYYWEWLGKKAEKDYKKDELIGI